MNIAPTMFEDFILWLLKKITGKIFFPKNPEEILKKENQKILFKNNVFIVNSNGRYGLSDINNPPKELIEILKNTLGDNKHSNNDTQIVNASFHEELYSLTEFFKQGDLPLEKIRPYLNEENESILLLAEHIRRLLDVANHDLAQRTKQDMGPKERKLCNLYLRGYINKIIEEYAYKWIESKDLSENEKNKRINDLIEEILRNSDSIFFIFHSIYYNAEEIFLKNISKKISINAEFIAIHAGGKANIKMLDKIMKGLEKESDFKRYDIKKNNYLDEKSRCPLVDIYMRLIKEQKLS